ncbi:MAG: arabinose efflux permease family protein [Holophagaceae bacterium]|nr:arabinose efflux permease family protein [Holophagaceae bacterium]
MARPGSKKVLLCAVTLCFWFAQYIYIPFLTPYLMTLAISATVVGAIVGAYGLTQLLLRIPLGITLDLFRNHRLVIILGVFLAGISSIGMLVFPSPLMLFISNALSGVASSTWISFTILYASYYEGQHSTKAIGIINVCFQSGILLAFLAGGILFGRFGIQSLFKTSFASGMLGTLLALCIRHEPSAKGTNVTVASLLKVVKDRRVICFSLLCTVAWFVVFATVFSFSTSTAKALGATGPQLGVLSMLYSVGTIGGAYFVATRVAHAFGENRLLSAGFLILAVYCIGIPLTRDLRLFYPLQLLCGLGNGVLLAATMAFAVKDVEPEKKTTAMGFFQSIYCFGITLGPVVMGVLIDHSTKLVAFLFVGALALACAILVPLIYRSGYLGGRPASEAGLPSPSGD